MTFKHAAVSKDGEIENIQVDEPEFGDGEGGGGEAEAEESDELQGAIENVGDAIMLLFDVNGGPCAASVTFDMDGTPYSVSVTLELA